MRRFRSTVFAAWLAGLVGAVGCLSTGVAHAQAQVVKDVNRNGDSNPKKVEGSLIMLLGLLAYFWPDFVIGDDGNSGREPYVSDGTANGTKRLADVNPGAPSSDLGPMEAYVDASSNTVWGIFAATRAGTGEELFKLTPAGVALLKDINPGGADSSPIELTFWPFGAGKTPLVLFAADDGTHGCELWRSDGTASGTNLVKDINQGTQSSIPSGLAVIDDVLYFAADDGTRGAELWKSDGTPNGTVLVKDIQPGSGGSEISGMTAIGDTLFFAANDGTTGREPWKSDGTTAGTVLIKDISTGPLGSFPAEFTPGGDEVFFGADDNRVGYELWKTNGTASGTILVRDIAPGLTSSSPSQLTPFGDTLLFQADDGRSGAEPWKSDGSANGTVLVRDINPGAGSSLNFGHFWVFGTRHGYFAADDGTVGNELWKTDGTTAGTNLVQDLNPGAPSSDPGEMSLYRGKILFAARHPQLGNEPWVYGPGATSQPIGIGCGAHSLRYPSTRASDPVIGKIMQITGTDAEIGSTGIVVIGPGAGKPTPFGNCYSLVDLGVPVVLIGVFQVTNSEWQLNVPIPANSSLTGGMAMLQTWYLFTKSPLGIDLTNGVLLTLGN